MIKKLRLKNFKCYGQKGADFNLAKINFIYGNNSVGKSSFLQFLKLLVSNVDHAENYSRDVFDRYRFRGQPVSESAANFVSAQIRVIPEGTDALQPTVLHFEPVQGEQGLGSYRVRTDSGVRVDAAFWDAVLPKGDGQDRIQHHAAPRNRNDGKEMHKEEKSTCASAFLTAGFQQKVMMETDRAAVEYLDGLYHRLGMHYSCVCDADGKASSSRIHDVDFDIDVDVADIGTGMAGLIDLAFTLKNWKGGILALEEPETNVNEAQLAALVQVLVEEAKKRPTGCLIVECHSELMVSMLKNLLHKKELSPEELSVMVVTKQATGSQVEKIDFDDCGNMLTPWPGGYFPALAKVLDDFYSEPQS